MAKGRYEIELKILNRLIEDDEEVPDDVANDLVRVKDALEDAQVLNFMNYGWVGDLPVKAYKKFLTTKLESLREEAREHNETIALLEKELEKIEFDEKEGGREDVLVYIQEQ